MKNALHEELNDIEALIKRVQGIHNIYYIRTNSTYMYVQRVGWIMNAMNNSLVDNSSGIRAE